MPDLGIFSAPTSGRSHSAQFHYRTVTLSSKLRIADSSGTVVPSSGNKTSADPLCSLFITFSHMDNPHREITTKHVFTTKKQRQYPQTRRVVYTPTPPPRGGNQKMSSLSSPPYYHSEDELEQIERRRIGSAGQTFSGLTSATGTPTGLLSGQIVQEVSLTYSAPLTITPPVKKDEPLKVSVTQAHAEEDYGNVKSKSSSYREYSSSYGNRIIKPRQIDSVERVNASGRQETEFPVRVTYVGGDSISPNSQTAFYSVPIVPIGTPIRVYDPAARGPYQRVSSGVSDTIVSETTTIEELTTITTTNTSQRRGNNQHQQSSEEMPLSPNSVNALTQQFEQTARKEYTDAQKVKKSPKSPAANQSHQRVVVVSKSGSDFNYGGDDSRVRRVERSGFSPTEQRAVLSTTVVDIEPPGYRSVTPGRTTPRYVEETYQLSEEFHSVRTYGSPSQRREQIVSPDSGRREVVREAVREHISISRSSSPARESDNEQTRGSTPVRSVVEQFESKIDAETRRSRGTVRHEGIDEYTVERRETKEKPKEVYIPRGDYIPSRAIQPPPKSPSPPPREAPKPKPIEVFIPKVEPEPRKKEDVSYVKSTDRNIKVDAWEEITTTTRRREQEQPAPPVPAFEPPVEEPKKEEPPVVTSTAKFTPIVDTSRDMNSGFTTTRRTEELETSTRTRTVGPTIGTGVTPMTDTYSPSIGSRRVFETSSTTSYTAGALSGNRFRSEIGTPSLSGLSPFGQNAASAIRDAREREKKEMSDLNDRLASYIEKVRFLEAQNRKLASDLEMLQNRWGSDTTSVRVMYESELKTAQIVIDETNRQRDALEQEIRRLMAELTEYRKKFDDATDARNASRAEADALLERLCKLEAEINLVKRRIANVEEEVDRIKRENKRLLGELSRHRTIIEQESLNRIDFQNQVQTLLEECQYVGRVHNNELGDLVVMAHRDTTPENREFFKNELAAAIRDIRAEYDQISNSTRHDMESWYKLKVQEIHTQSNRVSLEQNYAREEVKKLRVTLSEMRSKLADLEGRNVLLEKQIQELNYQLEDDQRSYEAALQDRDNSIRKMREECQALMVELQMLLDTKQTLDAEIAIYRKMLEGEENRAGLRQLVEQVVKTNSYTSDHAVESVRVLKSETSSRSNFQRSAKGNVSIQETSPDGRFIVIENTHRSKEENIGEWKLKRRVDGKRENVYTFPRDFILKPLKTVKVFARGQGVHSPPDSLVFDGDENWGTGNSVQTFLYNKDGEERASHTQRQSYS